MYHILQHSTITFVSLPNIDVSPTTTLDNDVRITPLISMNIKEIILNPNARTQVRGDGKHPLLFTSGVYVVFYD